MEEMKYLRFCPKHGNVGEDATICPKCGKQTVLSDITQDQLSEWTNSEIETEKKYPNTVSVALSVGLEKILSRLRSGKDGEVRDALKLLAFRPERDEYIAEVINWQNESKGNRSVAAAEACSLFLSRCTYEKVRPYLDFRNYNHRDSNSVKLFMPFFLEHYKHQKPLSCEKCGRETNNLFFKITTTKNEGKSVRKGSWVYTELHYTGHAIPHVYCDDCALKKAKKKRKLKKLSDTEKIKAWMNFNSDINAKNCGDENSFFASLEMDTPGFGYDYLTSSLAMAEMLKNEADKAMLAGMIECALELKKTLDEMP